ncbi:MAG: YeeE/YedE family protein [Acidobacteriota bacterium]|nr:YeeE/YedE family protein [Acidobacteriota bacterium]
MPLLIYFGAGTLFGIVITKAEVISWFRIQEMFRFDAFHMFGIFATAIPVAIVTVQALKRSQWRASGGVPITLAPKVMGTGARYILGGTTFGLGWALTGACPGPLFALVGGGVTVLTVAIASALCGTWLYGRVRHLLPH